MHGSPLRWPKNDDEWAMAGLERTSRYGYLIGTSFPNARRAAGAMEDRLPFLFKMPATEEQFRERKLRGDYKELARMYRPDDIVDELGFVEVQHVCVLRGIDSDDYCHLSDTKTARSGAITAKVAHTSV